MSMDKLILGYYTYKLKWNWDCLREKYDGFYRVIEETTETIPVYIDDFIEPYEHKLVDYVIIENIETSETHKLSKSLFLSIFETISN